MIQNGRERLELFLEMKDPTDYWEFVDKCKEAKVKSMRLAEYIHKMGTVLVAASMYPSMDTGEAYLKVVKEMNEQAVSDVNMSRRKKSASSGCKGCGQKKPRNGGGIR